MAIKYFTIQLFLAILIASPQSFGHKRYPVRNGDRWGFIDSTGKVVVPFKYRNVNEFSEGLAAVREQGTFGYIDENGAVVIPFIYDWGEAFKAGSAIVYRNGKPFIIDRAGRIQFEHAYVGIEQTSVDRLWIVTTAENHVGLINYSGRLVFDTLYKSFGPFLGGKATLHRDQGKRGEKDYKVEAAIVDIAGNFITPFGKYEQIATTRDGYYQARRISDSLKQAQKDQILDRNGQILMDMSTPEWYISDQEFRAEYLPVSIWKNNSKTSTSTFKDIDKYYGVINPNGKLLFSDTSWCSFIPFSSGRAFAGYCTDGRSMSLTEISDYIRETHPEFIPSAIINPKSFMDRKLKRAQLEEAIVVKVIGWRMKYYGLPEWD